MKVIALCIANKLACNFFNTKPIKSINLVYNAFHYWSFQYKTQIPINIELFSKKTINVHHVNLRCGEWSKRLVFLSYYRNKDSILSILFYFPGRFYNATTKIYRRKKSVSKLTPDYWPIVTRCYF